MADQGYSPRFAILFNPEIGTRTVMSPYAVDICCSVCRSDKTVSELSGELGLPVTTVQGIVSKMYSEGLLIRFEDKQDFRKTRYHPACNTLLTDSASYPPLMSSFSDSTGPLGIYGYYRARGVDLWDIFSYLGLKLEYRVDELVDPHLDYDSDRLEGCLTVADGDTPVNISWGDVFVLRQDADADRDPEGRFRQAILGCALVKAIRNNTEVHFQYRPRVHTGVHGTYTSIFYNRFNTLLGVEGQSQLIMKSDYHDAVRRKVVFSLDGRAYIFTDGLMSSILETLCERECDIRDLVETLDRQKMTVSNAIGKLMEIGFVTLKDPLRKRGRLYRTSCVKVLEVNPLPVDEGSVTRSESFWRTTDVSDFDSYLDRAFNHVLETAGIRLFRSDGSEDVQ